MAAKVNKMQRADSLSIHTGDWHIGLNREQEFFGKTQNEIIAESINQMVDHAVKVKAKRFFVEGDIFTNKRPTPEDEKVFSEFLNRCIDEKIHVIAFQGNHEANEFASSGLEQFAESYRGCPLVTILTQPESLRVGDLNYVIVPHIHLKDLDKKKGETEKQFLRSAVNRLASKKTTNILLGHFHASGSVIGSESFLLANGANTNEMGMDDLIEMTICGHIHKHQHIKKTNTWIPGSIVYNDFGEREDTKGFLVLDETKLKMQFVELNTLPWRQYELDLTEKISQDQFAKEIALMKKKLKGCVAKIVTSITNKTKHLYDFEAMEVTLAEVCALKEHKIINTSKKRATEAVVNMPKKITPRAASAKWLAEVYEGEDNTGALNIIESVIQQVEAEEKDV